MKIKLLYPSDYFDIKKVDSEYENEYKVTITLPEFDIYLFNYDEFISDCKLKIYPDSFEEGLCIYRGWMLKPEQYKQLYEKLKDNGLSLINDPQEYERCHLFPNTYEEIKDFTPKTKWHIDYKQVDWDSVNNEFKKFMIKDYVKSVKGTNFPAYFETPVNQEMMNMHLEEFVKLRGTLFTKGIVIKESVTFKKYGEFSNEYRVFYMNGKLVTISNNSNQPDNAAKIPIEFVKMFSKLGSNFYTVDFAELEDGKWIVIETGDGQVSGLSPNQCVFKFYDEILGIIK